MSKMLFRRAAATGAAFVTLGFAAAMSLSPVTSAATIRPAASQTVHAPQILRHPGHWCHRFWHPWCDDEDWGGGGGNGWSGGGGGSSDCADGKGGNGGNNNTNNGSGGAGNGGNGGCCGSGANGGSGNNNTGSGGAGNGGNGGNG